MPKGTKSRRGAARGGRASLERLLDHHASRLVRAPIPELPEAIVAALEAVGRRIGADRATLWGLRPPERRLAPLHAWSKPGYGLTGATFGVDEVPWLVQELGAGRRISFRSCASLPREAASEKSYFSRHGPRSAAIVPLVVGDATLAALVVGTVRRERGWGGATLAFLERAAVVLASALVRKRGHDASFETESRLGGVLEAGPDGILFVRRSGRIELANRRASAIFLRTREELCAERLQDLLAPAPELLDARAGPARLRGRGAIEALLESDAPLQLCARRGDGSTVPVEVTLRELRAPRDELFCCGVRDVSGDQRAREETIRLREELAFMGRPAMLAEMGAGIAHELNQPLTAVLSNAETAQRLLASAQAPDVAELREMLRDVVNDTRRAAQVLARMREMLRHGKVERAPVDVAALLEGVARLFREESIARSIRLTTDIAARLPPVLADRIQVEQVVMNLVLNAIEAMGEATGAPRTVVLRARATEPDGVDVSVRDSGPGLGDDALAHAFDAFFTTKARGLGMGLSISRSIVEAHGGRLLARNNADRGATFEFHLPAAPAPDVAADRRRPA